MTSLYWLDQGLSQQASLPWLASSAPLAWLECACVPSTMAQPKFFFIKKMKVTTQCMH